MINDAALWHTNDQGTHNEEKSVNQQFKTVKFHWKQWQSMWMHHTSDGLVGMTNRLWKHGVHTRNKWHAKHSATLSHKNMKPRLWWKRWGYFWNPNPWHHDFQTKALMKKMWSVSESSWETELTMNNKNAIVPGDNNVLHDGDNSCVNHPGNHQLRILIDHSC